MKGSDKDIKVLRELVWKKAIGTPQIVFKSHFYKKITKIVIENIDISKIKNRETIHWETVKNFFERDNTRLDTLDIFSWYVLGGDEPKSFENFKIRMSHKNTTNPNWIVVPIIALLTCFVLYLILPRGSDIGHGQPYLVHFTGKNLDSLLMDNWQRKNVDELAWQRFEDKPFLTLGTEVGDYFVDLSYEEARIEEIKNLIYRPINCGDCCIIELKLSNFHPNEPYQQAGLFLFHSDTIDRRNHIRFTYLYDKKQNSDLDVSDSTKVGAILNVEAKHQHLESMQLPRKKDSDLRTDSIWLKVRINEGKYAFSFKRNDSGEYTLVWQSDQELIKTPPLQVALGAFQGHSTICLLYTSPSPRDRG